MSEKIKQRLFRGNPKQVERKRKIFPDPCEWNPDKQLLAFGDEVHASAELIVGADDQLRLCKACAALPIFDRFRSRREIVSE